MSSRWRRALAPGVLLMFAAAAPLAAGFNDLVQVICDEDNFITTGCDLTHDGLRFVHTVAVSPDDKHVYVCSSLADSASEAPIQKESLSAYSRAMDGTLSLIDQEIEDSGGVTTLRSCRGVAVSPDGKHVYTAALLDRAVTWFSRNTTMASPDFGKLTFTAGDSISTPAAGGNLGGATAVVVSPDNKHVYVIGRSADSLVAFSRDTTTGDLTQIDEERDGVGDVDGLNAPEGLAISSDGKHLYVASQDDNAVAVFARDADSMSGDFGKLTFVEARFDGVGGVNGLDRAARVALDPSGDNVYVGTVVDNTPGDWFAVFARNTSMASPDFGKLTLLQSFQDTAVTFDINCSGVGPEASGIAVAPSGLFVAVASPFFGGLATFSRAADGTLTFVESICDEFLADDDEIGAILEIAASADGKHLYTAGGAFSLHSVIDYECDSANVDLVLDLDSVADNRTESACRSVRMENEYHVLAAGVLTVTSPVIVVGDDVSVTGEATLFNAVP